MGWKRTKPTTRCNYLMQARKVLWDRRIPEKTELRCLFTTHWVYLDNPRECIRRCEVHYHMDRWAQEMMGKMLDSMAEAGYMVIPYIPLQTPQVPLGPNQTLTPEQVAPYLEEIHLPFPFTLEIP